MTNKSPTAQHLSLGTRIDGGALEIVEVLGVGGYGVVYRAIETCPFKPQSYAVKCLVNSQEHHTRRQLHIREIALHQLTSVHPGVITLHRVVEDRHYTYIIMDYAPDHDLFTQILNNCRYLGNDALIKHVFLQLVDAVEYCHSLGIYHRDLKPENILCFDNGSRVAITDFGLATTEKVSQEMRTGSIYHMSPECQGDEFSSSGSYSPMFNDIWSLGIILLNLATGRNPWRTATPDDLTFQAYLQDPLRFFPSVLPISPEVNDILVRMLHVDWTERMTLAELRQEMEEISSFYSPYVIFEGSQARCVWELTATQGITLVKDDPGPCDLSGDVLKSYWSTESHCEYRTQIIDPSGWPSDGRNFVIQSLESLSGDNVHITMVDRQSSRRSSSSSYSLYSSAPSTPDSTNVILANRLPSPNLVTRDMFDKARNRDEDMLHSSSSSSPGVDSKHEGSTLFFYTNKTPSLDTPLALHQ